MEAQETVAADEVVYADILEGLGNIHIYKAELGDADENLVEAYKLFEMYLIIYDNMKQIDENYEAKYHKGEYYEGKIYHTFSQIMDKEKNLNKAIKLYEKFLEIYKTAEHDLDYANARVSLGKAYAELLEAGREEYFDKALESFEEALKIITIDNSFYDYAVILAQEAKVYTKMGEIKASREYFEKAIEKNMEALQVCTANESPFEYALIKTGLGDAYRGLARLEEKEENINKAVAAYAEVLEIQDIEELRLRYAKVQYKLGLCYFELAGLKNPEQNIKKALEYFEKAQRICSEEGYPILDDQIVKAIEQLCIRFEM